MEATSTATPIPDEKSAEKVKFTLNFKKQNFDIEFPLSSTLNDLRLHIASLTGVAAGLQKLMYKGMLKDDNKTLSELAFKDGAKLMLVGSSISEVMTVASATTPQEASKIEAEKPASEPLSDQLPHKKIIDKGLPEGVEPGKIGRNEPLPQTPISGVLNNLGIKVRLTFKVWSQELWIQSATSTQKIPFGTIRSVASEPIKGNEQYHIVVSIFKFGRDIGSISKSLQLGASDRNKYFLYWVPCQYTRAMKSSIMSDFM